ncbi:Carbonic anhydrase [Mycena chlorophos]|uniref:Carbonic anhydrase n=1 Tax=Mycena chlorophos TaxID=658473 RepID=A0A8H6TUC1_MYCCL|nr:Carbonic anhydrase [Mycena chlorophos]
MATHPDLQRFFASNAEWAKHVDSKEPTFFTESAKGQKPHVLWIGCSDSRVPESVITASRPGDIFVHRNIAKWVHSCGSIQIHSDDASVAAVLTYAVDFVGVEHVIIVGHTECGGAAACFAGAHASTFTDSDTNIVVVPGLPADAPLNKWLTPLTKLTAALKLSSVPAAEALPVIVEENVKRQVENLAKSPTITSAWANKSKAGKQVWIHGWVYDLKKGELRDLGISRGPTA